MGLSLSGSLFCICRKGTEDGDPGDFALLIQAFVSLSAPCVGLDSLSAPCVGLLLKNVVWLVPSLLSLGPWVPVKQPHPSCITASVEIQQASNLHV